MARRVGGAAVEAACDDALRSASRGCHWLREECSYGRFWEDLRIEVEDSWVSSSSIRGAAQGQQKAGVGDKRFGAAGFFLEEVKESVAVKKGSSKATKL